jgi:hypothetical protein
MLHGFRTYFFIEVYYSRKQAQSQVLFFTRPKILLDFSPLLWYNMGHKCENYSSKKFLITEKPLDTSVAEFAIFLFCMIGCGIQCWHLGKTTGVEATVQYMIDTGVLEVEEDS